jgi:hypothetical protein
MRRRQPEVQYLLCVRNGSYVASLQVRRLYERLPDERAALRGLVRVVDESGDDYLYPRELFADLDVPRTVARALIG